MTVTAAITIVSLDFSQICLPHPSTTASLLIREVFAKAKNLGSTMEKACDDRFPPQTYSGKDFPSAKSRPREQFKNKLLNGSMKILRVDLQKVKNSYSAEKLGGSVSLEVSVVAA